jgi:hypothetical protein
MCEPPPPTTLIILQVDLVLYFIYYGTSITLIPTHTIIRIRCKVLNLDGGKKSNFLSYDIVVRCKCD